MEFSFQGMTNLDWGKTKTRVESPPFVSPTEPSAREDEKRFQIPRVPPSKDNYSIKPLHLFDQITVIGTMLTQFEKFADQMGIELDSPWVYDEFLHRLIRMQGEYQDLAEQLMVHQAKIKTLEAKKPLA
ncbi:hypothetical protein R1flu_005352 [Riccia fluitans]|uniref:Uncharacterized protein n=1 Tax=Riccia fluitans TaxID=41844 RepID=A0ABD1YSX8_9MARC